jgi:cobaltochelatase CobS
MNNRQRLIQEASKRWPGHGAAWLKCTEAEIQGAFDTGELPAKLQSAPAVNGDLAALIAAAIAQYMPVQEQALDVDAVTALITAAIEKDKAESLLTAPDWRNEIREEIAKAVADMKPARLEIVQGEKVVTVNVAEAHEAFASLMELVQEGHHNLLMVGPAGSGKTTLAHTLATALGLGFDFLSLSAGVTETHLLGRVLPQADGSWQYQRSAFVKTYEEGGVFLLDEIDAADANLMVAINAALANGVLSNPITGNQHKRHKDTYIIGAANTWGRGGDSMYVGRNQLDAATLDRFVLATLFVDYDGALEQRHAEARLSADEAGRLLDWIANLRRGIASNKLRRVASTRLVISAAAAMAAGRTLSDVRKRYHQDWSADEKSKIERGN